MKKNYPIIFIIALLLMVPRISEACWVYLTVEELVEKSDVIVIGEVSGRANGRIKTNEVKYNKWQVKPYYYIKGDIRDSNLIVGTPDEKTSLHYDLNDQGNTVILFLRKDGDDYMPHSPQAVVGVDFANDKIKEGKDLSGEEMVKLVKIKVQSMEAEERDKLTDYLMSVEDIHGPIHADKTEGSLKIVGVLIVAGAILGIFLVIKKNKTSK